MESMAPFFILSIAVLIGVFVFYSIRKDKEENIRKLQLTRNLEFTPVEPDQVFTDRINQLYHQIPGKSIFELRNVSHMTIPDGEMFLFDLVNTAGEGDSNTEEQAIAVVSQYLNLPEFTIYPQLDIHGFGSKFANTLVRWVVSKVGDSLDFPEHLEFQKRYLVSSQDEQGTREFLDGRKLHMLAQVQLLGIHAGGDLFVLSKFDQVSKPVNRESFSERISQAVDVFQIFTS